MYNLGRVMWTTKLKDTPTGFLKTVKFRKILQKYVD